MLRPAHLPGTCSYFYEGQPETQTCGPDYAEVICSVQVPPATPLSLKWYYSQTSNRAGATLIESAAGGKYQITFSLADIPQEDTGLVVGRSELFIVPFSDSDTGYYWCQMVEDGNPLPPSDTQYLTFDDNCAPGNVLGSKCVKDDSNVTPSPTSANIQPTGTLVNPKPTVNVTMERGAAPCGVVGGALSTAVYLTVGLVSVVFMGYMC